jgi:hypothetical protein
MFAGEVAGDGDEAAGVGGAAGLVPGRAGSVVGGCVVVVWGDALSKPESSEGGVCKRAPSTELIHSITPSWLLGAKDLAVLGCLSADVRVGAEEHKDIAEATHCLSLPTASTVLVSALSPTESSSALILTSAVAKDS